VRHRHLDVLFDDYADGPLVSPRRLPSGEAVSIPHRRGLCRGTGASRVGRALTSGAASPYGVLLQCCIERVGAAAARVRGAADWPMRGAVAHPERRAQAFHVPKPENCMNREVPPDEPGCADPFAHDPSVEPTLTPLWREAGWGLDWLRLR